MPRLAANTKLRADDAYNGALDEPLVDFLIRVQKSDSTTLRMVQEAQTQTQTIAITHGKLAKWATTFSRQSLRSK